MGTHGALTSHRGETALLRDLSCSAAMGLSESAVTALSLRSHMFQGCIASPCLCRGIHMLVVIDKHLWLGRDILDERDRVCEDPCLLDFYLTCVRCRCEEPTRARLLLCPLRLRERLLGCLAGYVRCPNIRQWCLEHHLRMLLNNESRRFPQVWKQTEVVGTLDPTVMMDVPRVAEWLRTFTVHSKPMRMFVTRAQAGLLLRYEQWVLRSPTQRTEHVQAYRTRTAGVCPCCHRPAFWKIPRGEKGCSAHILRLVAERNFQVQWQLLACQLSRSKQSPFEQSLLLGEVNSNVFEWLFCDPDCLSCSCDRCTLQQARAGVICPADLYYVNQQLQGQDSPRQRSDPLLPVADAEAWFVAFDREVIALTDRMRVLPYGV